MSIFDIGCEHIRNTNKKQFISSMLTWACLLNGFILALWIPLKYFFREDYPFYNFILNSLIISFLSICILLVWWYWGRKMFYMLKFGPIRSEETIHIYNPDMEGEVGEIFMP